jgi:hypothetical protein
LVGKKLKHQFAQTSNASNTVHSYQVLFAIVATEKDIKVMLEA